MCKLIIFVCLVAILYSLARSFLFPTREGISPPVTILTDFVTGAKNALESIFGKVKIDGKWVHIGRDNYHVDIEVDDGNILATIKTTGAKGRGHLNGDKIENFQWLNQNGEPTGPVYSATLKLDNNKKVSVIPWVYGAKHQEHWIRAAPQIDKPYCQFNVFNKCKAYPDVPKLGWFKDQDHGGPKPTTEQACEARRQSWIGSCGHQNVSMAFDSVLNHLLDKPVNIISVPYNQHMRALWCWAGSQQKCRLGVGQWKDEDKWIIKKSGDKYTITSVTGNKPLGSVYCSDAQVAGGQTCRPDLWGNDTEIKWDIINMNDNVFQIKNYNGKNLAMINCWQGEDKCEIAMRGNSEEIKWKIQLASKAPKSEAPKPDEAPKPAGKCVPNVPALAQLGNPFVDVIAAKDCPKVTTKEACGPIGDTPAACAWVE